MVDLQSILAEHRSKNKSGDVASEGSSHPVSTSSEIPDVFFDKIVIDFKLNRIEILVLMYIYRKVWCLPNMHRSHGISPMMSHTEMAKKLALTIEEVYTALRKLEEYEMIKTIRAGQYFSRKYFTKLLDAQFNHVYDDFDV